MEESKTLPVEREFYDPTEMGLTNKQVTLAWDLAHTANRAYGLVPEADFATLVEKADVRTSEPRGESTEGAMSSEISPFAQTEGAEERAERETEAEKFAQVEAAATTKAHKGMQKQLAAAKAAGVREEADRVNKERARLAEMRHREEWANVRPACWPD